MAWILSCARIDGYKIEVEIRVSANEVKSDGESSSLQELLGLVLWSSQKSCSSSSCLDGGLRKILRSTKW